MLPTIWNFFESRILFVMHTHSMCTHWSINSIKLLVLCDVRFNQLGTRFWCLSLVHVHGRPKENRPKRKPACGRWACTRVLRTRKKTGLRLMGRLEYTHALLAPKENGEHVHGRFAPEGNRPMAGGQVHRRGRFVPERKPACMFEWECTRTLGKETGLYVQTHTDITHTYTFTHITHTYTFTHEHTLTYTHSHTHTHTNSHTHTYTHSHTHTHTHLNLSAGVLSSGICDLVCNSIERSEDRRVIVLRGVKTDASEWCLLVWESCVPLTYWHERVVSPWITSRRRRRWHSAGLECAGMCVRGRVCEWAKNGIVILKEGSGPQYLLVLFKLCAC